MFQTLRSSNSDDQRTLYHHFKTMLEKLQEELRGFTDADLAFEVSPTLNRVELDYDHARENGAITDPVLEAEMEACLAFLDRLRGRPVHTPIKYREPFSASVSRYLKFKTEEAQLKAQSIQSAEQILRLFGNEIKDRPVASISRSEAVAFRDKLGKIPSDWGRWRDVDRSRLTLDMIIARATDKSAMLKPQTRNKYIHQLGDLWNWLDGLGEMEGSNPFSNLSLPVHRSQKESYKPYWEEELVHLFGAVPSKKPWLPEVTLVALYSGMRQDEIGSLQWRDLQTREGLHFFDLHDAKTAAGDRQVPVHSALLSLLERRPNNPQEFVWPELIPEGPDKKRGQHISKKFGVWRRSRELTREGLAFHSFRKNASGCLERAGIPDNSAAQVIGHERQVMTYSVYSPDGLTLPQKQKIIESIRYPVLEAEVDINSLWRA